MLRIPKPDLYQTFTSLLHLVSSLNVIMDYETASSRLLPDISLVANYSFISDIMDNPTNSLAWVLLIKIGVPSFLPYLLLGPAIQLLTSSLLLPYTPASVLGNSARRLKWRLTFIARLSAAITGS